MAGSSAHPIDQAVLDVLAKHENGAGDDVVSAALPAITAVERVTAYNRLLQAAKVTLWQDAKGAPLYKLQRDTKDSARLKGLAPEDLLVLQCITAAGNMGIWTRDMRSRTNLAQPRVNRALRALEERRLVKSVKSVQHASRKVYMLAELEPAREVSGGPWYGPDAFDTEFIDVLRDCAREFIKQRGQASVAQIADFIRTKQVSRQELSDTDIRHVVDTLDMDGVVEKFRIPRGAGGLGGGPGHAAQGHEAPHGVPGGRAAKRRRVREGGAASSGEESDEGSEGSDEEGGVIMYRMCSIPYPASYAGTDMPCGVCPVADDCHEGGEVSPEKCRYFRAWLDF